MINSMDVDFLSNCLSFWQKLSINEKNSIINNVALVKYNQGANIHSGENDCIGILIVKSGELRTYILSEDGKEVTLYRLSKGEICILSASCILKGITFDVHIDAEVDSEILLINSQVFSHISEQNIYVENFSYKIVIDRFSKVMWAMEQILFLSMDSRLATFFITEISKSGTDTIKLTHEQIAKYIGSAREVVSRMLKYFENEDIVRLSRGGIKILNKSKLEKLTNKYR
jgi:CRP/FNR family transcriptional regulator